MRAKKNNLTERFAMRMSKEDLETLSFKASQLGVSDADYIRILIRSTTVELKVVPKGKRCPRKSPG